MLSRHPAREGDRYLDYFQQGTFTPEKSLSLAKDLNSPWDHMSQLSRDHMSQLSWDQMSQLSRDHVSQLSWDHMSKMSRDQISQFS